MNLSANSHNIEATTVTLGSINGAGNTSTTLGKGTLNMAGGNLAVLSDLSLGLFVGTTGTARGELNLTGGTLTLTRNLPLGNQGDSAAFNQPGGRKGADAAFTTLKATANLTDEERHQVFEANARRVFPRLDAQLKQKGL